jgi:hypothetical protein
MAEIVTGTTTGFVNTADLLRDHSDIRREIADAKDVLNDATRVEGGSTRFQGAANTSEIIKEGLKESFAARGDTKDTRYDLATRIADAKAETVHQSDRVGDTLTKQNSDYFIANQQYAFQASRDLAALKATTDMALMKIGSDIATQAALGQAATALESAKVAAAVALGQSQLSKEIFQDGSATRALINDLKYHDLNRALVERNAELVEERHYGRHWRGIADQNQFGAQFAQLQSMMQNFNSQLADTRQGMVNFGTMAGVGQTSSANNVR